MSSMVVGGYKSANVANPKGRYREPFVVTTPIFYHRDGHYVRPNTVAFKYLDFKKDVDPNARVKVFKYVIKANT
jgi:hypothetical protein